MGGYLLVNKSCSGYDQKLIKSREEFRKSGFGSFTTVENSIFVVDIYAKITASDYNLLKIEGDDFIASIGSFFYKNQKGSEALRKYFDCFDPRKIDLSGTAGIFSLIISKSGRTFVLNDRVGNFKIYFNSTREVFTNSFLACCSTENKLTVNPLNAMEFVFQCSVLGNETVFYEVNSLDTSEYVDLSGVKFKINSLRKEYPITVNKDLDYHLEKNTALLTNYFAGISGLFDDILLPLSGGYDTRLLLSLAYKNQITPELMVYGDAKDDDVLIAKHICQKEKLKLNHINKAISSAGTYFKDYSSEVETVFYEGDGLIYGGIFGNSSELSARRNRSMKGNIFFSGSGGEVYRNFFNLFDTGITAKELVWCFYRGFSKYALSNPRDIKAYDENVSRKIDKALDIRGAKIERHLVDYLYVFFRCHSFSGKTASINNRFGHYSYPFIDYEIAMTALEVPTKYKWYGEFEAKLIARLSESLAKYPSDHGYNFYDPLTLKYRVLKIRDCIQPPVIRPLRFYTKQYLKKVLGFSKLSVPEKPYELVDRALPYTRNIFDISKIGHIEFYKRVLTLEYLFEKLNAEL